MTQATKDMPAVFLMKIVQRDEIFLRPVLGLKEFGLFWEPANINSDISPRELDLKVGELVSLVLDAGIFKPSVESTVFLTHLILFFKVDINDAAASVPIKLVNPPTDPKTPTLGGNLPVIQSPVQMTNDTISFVFEVLNLPPGVKEKTFFFRVAGQMAVNPHDQSLPFNGLGNSLPFSFDPQMRISTGPGGSDQKPNIPPVS